MSGLGDEGTEKSRAAKPCRWALLIASPLGSLKGPVNDVESIAALLHLHHFSIEQLCGSEATRNAILRAWQQLIDQCEEDDVAIIYYSGHGGLVESTPKPRNKDNSEQLGAPKHYQFILPMDYNQQKLGDFRGILDVELSVLLRKTTNKTRNVITIFDCCHSGRMARDPRHGTDAVPKGLSKVEYHDLSNHVAQLQAREQLDLDLTSLESNEHAVRLVAAADCETAWEYTDERHRRVGAFTKALISVLDEALQAPTEESGASWKLLMPRVRELVNAEFPEQHPQVEGPYERIIFSLKLNMSSAMPVAEADGQVFIKAGQVAGIRPGNEYVLMSPKFLAISNEGKLADAKVESVTGFRAILGLAGEFHLPSGGAVAYQKSEVPYRWPIAFPDELKSSLQSLLESKFVRPEENRDNGMVIARACREGNNICLYSGSGTRCAVCKFDPKSQMHDMTNIIEAAEQLARAEHLLALQAPKNESLSHDLKITISPAGSLEESPQDGTAKLVAGDGIIINLHNGGNEIIYVSVFDVNVAGKISHVSTSSIEGVRLVAAAEYTLGRRQFTDNAPGLKMSWPRGLPESHTGILISESFVFIVSSEPVDLRDFVRARHREPRNDASQLEKLAHRLAYGHSRNCEVVRDIREVKWDMVRVPFQLCRR